ncbi:MAG TPA: hypothetical protein VI248_11330 [Kineosporiaceae bacterium]
MGSPDTTRVAPGVGTDDAVRRLLQRRTLAVAGPNLVEPLGHVATGLGVPALAGPFLLAAVAYLAAGAVLSVLLRPDPFLVARDVAALSPAPSPSTSR